MFMKMDLKFFLVTDKLFISLSEPSVLQYVNKVKRNGLNPSCQEDVKSDSLKAVVVNSNMNWNKKKQI